MNLNSMSDATDEISLRIREMFEALHSFDKSRRADALGKLTVLDQESVKKELLEFLKNGDGDVRGDIAKILMLIDPQNGSALTLSFLSDPLEFVRFYECG